MTQFITALRLELLILIYSQIFWGWKGSLFLQVDSLYPVVTVAMYFSLLDKRFELQGEKLLSVNLLSLTEGCWPNTSPVMIPADLIDGSGINEPLSFIIAPVWKRGRVEGVCVTLENLDMSLLDP